MFTSFSKTTVAGKNHVDYTVETGGGDVLLELTAPSKFSISATGLDVLTASLR